MDYKEFQAELIALTEKYSIDHMIVMVRHPDIKRITVGYCYKQPGNPDPEFVLLVEKANEVLAGLGKTNTSITREYFNRQQ